MSATEPQAQPPRPFTLAGASMRDLLASCAAAETVSTPPRLPDRLDAERSVERPKAA
ncbi:MULTISPECIES: hypothetical protein [Streptomyces]|uniref:Uncharacterized protein n=2 Tax=Streptomyces TaxID=1883 RepID=A0ABV9IXE5_9ACTN